MRTGRTLPALCAAFAIAASAAAQILPPVPPAAPATPPYTPPPPPPPPPVPPPRPEPKPADDKPLPSLIERDANGKLKRYQTSLEDAALAKMEFPPEQRARIDAALAARRKDIDKLVIEKLEAVLAARRVGTGISQMRDLGELLKVKDAITAIAPEKAVERLVREGAITPVIKARLDQMVRAYNAELMAERQTEVGTDIPRITQLAAADAFRDGTYDVFVSLDAMLAEAAKTIEVRGGKMGLSGDAAAAFATLQREVASLDAGSETDLKRRTELTRAFFFDKLDIAAQRALLQQIAAAE